MNEMPSEVTLSALWRRLSSQPTLKHAIESLRETALALSAKVEQILPDYTDHSVRHMDALWGVASKVLTEAELERVGPGEAFILGAAFYVHDLGMAVGVTEGGRSKLESTEAFSAAFSHLTQVKGMNESFARECAFRSASRDSHAKLAESLADELIPGLDRYLIESVELRRKWGSMIGQVAASHHWPLRGVEERLGKRGLLPDPSSDSCAIDLGFVACMLRVIDYAHINSGRARMLDRLLRSNISPASLTHWEAQEHISGPTREASLLVYASARPIESVEGWWTIFEMARGLSVEIENVSEYLLARNASVDRFSLKGVKGAASPQAFAHFVETKGFEPIDVRFRPDSMDRLIQLLGGRTLYGDDNFAALRELLQNAADAVRLRRVTESSAGIKNSSGEIIVAIENLGDITRLRVTDDGVGMSERVITNYLLGIASDYWHSSDFFADHPKVSEQGFRPVGRFGIGFLSVFMIGNQVEIDTQRHGGGDALQLTLQGIGRRGALRRRAPSLRSGTIVSVTLSPEYRSLYSKVHRVVQARAPMLDVSVVISEGAATTNLVRGWWKDISQEEFNEFLIEQRAIAYGPHRISKRTPNRRAIYDFELGFVREEINLRAGSELSRWPGKQPELITDRHRILAVPTASHILLCSRGFAIGWYPVQGLMGMVDEPDLKLNAARNTPLEWNSTEFRNHLISELYPHIQTSVDSLAHEPSIPARFEFLFNVARAYGHKCLIQTTLNWITIVEPPGNSRLVSPEQFMEIVGTANEVIIGYSGVGPWSIAGSAREHFPDAPQRALLIPISGIGQPNIRGADTYEEKQNLAVGPLEEHFTSKRQDEDELLPRAIFLNVIIELIATSWKVSRENLTNSRWSSKSSELYGYLTR